MESRLQIDILRQPDDVTCGPTCLHAVYRYHGDDLPLDQIIAEVPMLDTGGTLAVHLASHALRRGYAATIYTCNLQVFDPTWFRGEVDLAAKLHARRLLRPEPKVHESCAAYLEYLALGGEVRMLDLSAALLSDFLGRKTPILTGLSATWLYRDARESGPADDSDDIGGDPQGHFVVLCGYDPQRRTVLVADPYEDNPGGTDHRYEVEVHRVLCAILIGVLTYDGNLLVIAPAGDRAATRPESASPA